MVNKKLMYGLLGVSFAIFLFCIVLYLQKPKIAYIETNILIQKFEGVKEANLKFENNTSKWSASTDSLVKKWQNELKDYEKNKSRLTAKDRKLKEEILFKQQQQINKFTETVKQRTKEEQQKLLQTQFNEINDFISSYGKEKGYTFILGANGSGGLLYAEKGTNITEEVLDALNKAYNKQHGK